MFYNNVKKLVELPASPLGFLKNFCRRDDKAEFEQQAAEDYSRSPGRRSLREHKNIGLQGLKSRYRSEPALPFSNDNKPSVITAGTLPEILMNSVHHQQVHVSASEPTPPHSPADRRPNSVSEPPRSPREGKRKKLSHEVSSPSISEKKRKKSQGALSRHSIVIEPPKICTARDPSYHSDLVATRSETSSIHSELSVESYLELDEKALTKISYIVAELINTEKTYMQDLQDIVTGYMVPMEQCSDLFEPSLVKDIFINIKPIGDFHLNFLEKLDEYKKELDMLAACFTSRESEEGFSLYNEFCRKVPRSLDLISEMTKEQQTRQFIQDCKQHLNHFFPLSEFIHRPIQRILKYPLLLRDLQKYTAGTKYSTCIDAALDKITGVAIHINKVKRVQELETHEIIGWTGEPLLEYGILKLEQAFKVNGTDGRYLFLFEKLLLFTKQKDGKYQYKAHLLPSDIGMTEGDSKDCKFEIDKFKEKKKTTKFVIQAPSLDIKATWVYEIKRSVLENQNNITPQMREVLLKGIPSMNMTNEFDYILSKYKKSDFIYLKGFEENNTRENGPPTPDLDNSTVHQVVSPRTPKSPPQESAFAYPSPSPDLRQGQDDSGIEDPAPKNTVDYSSLDVKAIKDRWKQQEKLASSNTAPVRNFHRRMSPSMQAKLETWPLPDADENPADILKRNTRMVPGVVGSEGDVNREGEGSSNKPCLARISHLQDQNREKAVGPAKRDIQSLVAEDAANSQARYDILSPDSNNHPDCEGGTLFSALDTSNSRHQVVSPKQSNGSDDVFASPEKPVNNNNNNKTNLNDKKEMKKWKEDSLELSDSDDIVVKFTKSCNVSGTGTAKRNSYLIEKDLQKIIPNFSPHSSDSEAVSESESTADRVDRIKRMANKHKLKIQAERVEDIEADCSLTDTIMGLYDEQSSRCRTPNNNNNNEEEDEIVRKMSTLSTRDTSSPKNRGTARRNKEVDDKTLTKDENTHTRDRDTLTRDNIVYKGSSLIRTASPEEEEKIVMKPNRDHLNVSASPRTLTKNRLHRRAAQRGGKTDSDSDTETTSSSSKTSSRPKTIALQKSTARTSSGSPISKSDSSGSVQSIRGRANSGKSNSAKPVPGSVVQSATVKRAALRTRTPSFNQDDNPFASKSATTPCTRTESDPTPRAERKSVGTPTRSVPTDTPISRTRGTVLFPGATRTCSEGIAADRRSAYLNAAQSSSNSSKHDSTPKHRPRLEKSDPEIQELNSIRSSQLVARMKSQFQNNSKLRAPTRSATLKRRTERAHTTDIHHQRSQSSPAVTRRSSMSGTRRQTSRSSTRTSETGYLSSDSNKSGIAAPTKKTGTKRPTVRPGVSKTSPQTRAGLKSSQPASSRPNSLNLAADRRKSVATRPAEKRNGKVTRIPSPTKSPPGVRNSASASRLPARNSAAGPRPKVNSVSSRLQQGPASNGRLKNSNSSSKLKTSPSATKLKTSPSATKLKTSPSAPKLKNSPSASKLKNSGSSSRLKNSNSSTRLKTPTTTSKLKASPSASRVLQDSDVSDSSRANSPVKHSGIAIKTPSRPSAGFARTTSMADLNKSEPAMKPNLSKLQSLSKSTSSVNEKSVRQARREAAQRRAADIARSRDSWGEELGDVPEVSPNMDNRNRAAGRRKFVYGGHRTNSHA